MRSPPVLISGLATCNFKTKNCVEQLLEDQWDIRSALHNLVPRSTAVLQYLLVVGLGKNIADASDWRGQDRLRKVRSFDRGISRPNRIHLTKHFCDSNQRAANVLEHLAKLPSSRWVLLPHSAKPNDRQCFSFRTSACLEAFVRCVRRVNPGGPFYSKRQCQRLQGKVPSAKKRMPSIKKSSGLATECMNFWPPEIIFTARVCRISNIGFHCARCEFGLCCCGKRHQSLRDVAIFEKLQLAPAFFQDSGSRLSGGRLMSLKDLSVYSFGSLTSFAAAASEDSRRTSQVVSTVWKI